MNITKLYENYCKGEIDKFQFLQQARNNPIVKGMITPLMSFEDTVKALKSKGLIFEIELPKPKDLLTEGEENKEENIGDFDGKLDFDTQIDFDGEIDQEFSELTEEQLNQNKKSKALEKFNGKIKFDGEVNEGEEDHIKDFSGKIDTKSRINFDGKLYEEDKVETIDQPEYNYYIFDNRQGKIVEGFEYRPDAIERRAERGDNTSLRVYSRGFLTSKKGLDPSKNESWGSDEPQAVEETGLDIKNIRGDVEHYNVALTPEKLERIKKYAFEKDKPLYYEIEELEEKNADFENGKAGVINISPQFENALASILHDHAITINLNWDLVPNHSLNEGIDWEETAYNSDDKYNIDPTFLLWGIKTELSKQKVKDIKKATAAAINHLKKDPLYYTGIKEPKKRTDLPTKVKGEKTFVDKGNQMTKAKLPKVLEEGLGRFSEEVKNYISSNPFLKTISKDIQVEDQGHECTLRYIYYDPLPNEGLEALKRQFTVRKEINPEEEEQTTEGVYYIISPRSNPSHEKDLGGSFDKFKNKLNEAVKECLEEMLGANEPPVKKNSTKG